VYLTDFFRRTIGEVEVDIPDVVAEVRAAFVAYEEALVAHDLAALDAAFWDDPRVVRFAFGDVQAGPVAIAADRRARPKPTGARRMSRLELTTFGRDAAVVFAVFELDGGVVLLQSQTWGRTAEGWRVVAAHVSQSFSQT
jgi:hypothetical protein